jgi:hypothetical protein
MKCNCRDQPVTQRVDGTIRQLFPEFGGSDRSFYIARVFSDQESAIVAVIQIYGRTARLNRLGQLSAPYLGRFFPSTIRHSAFIVARWNRVPNLEARIDR